MFWYKQEQGSCRGEWKAFPQDRLQKDPSFPYQHTWVSILPGSHCPFQLRQRKRAWGGRREGREREGSKRWKGLEETSHHPLLPSMWPPHTSLSETQASLTKVWELGIHRQLKRDFWWQQRQCLATPQEHSVWSLPGTEAQLLCPACPQKPWMGKDQDSIFSNDGLSLGQQHPRRVESLSMVLTASPNEINVQRPTREKVINPFVRTLLPWPKHLSSSALPTLL